MATLVGEAMRRIFSIVDIRTLVCNERANLGETDNSLKHRCIADCKVPNEPTYLSHRLFTQTLMC
jgi:hypothetical protein